LALRDGLGLGGTRPWTWPDLGVELTGLGLGREGWVRVRGTWPWTWPDLGVELTGLGLEGWGLGLGICGRVNISAYGTIQPESAAKHQSSD